MVNIYDQMRLSPENSPLPVKILSCHQPSWQPWESVLLFLGGRWIFRVGAPLVGALGEARVVVVDHRTRATTRVAPTVRATTVSSVVGAGLVPALDPGDHKGRPYAW